MKTKKKSARQKKCEILVQRDFAGVKLESIRRVYKVVGLQNDGKSTILRTLIKELCADENIEHDYSAAQIERFVERHDTRAVVECNGMRIAIYTAGDNTGLIIGAFKYACEVKAQVLIMAVRTHEEGKISTAAEFTFSNIECRASFVSEEIVITGRKTVDNGTYQEYVSKVLRDVKKFVKTEGVSK